MEGAGAVAAASDEAGGVTLAQRPGCPRATRTAPTTTAALPRRPRTTAATTVAADFPLGAAVAGGGGNGIDIGG